MATARPFIKDQMFVSGRTAMATPSTYYNGTIDVEEEIYRLTGDAVFASTTFLAYSSLILFGREVQYVWKEPIRLASLIYILIRYPGVLSQLIDAGINSYTPRCTSIYRLGIWSENIAQTAMYLVQILRTYAVCGRSKFVAALLVALFLPNTAVGIYQALESSCGTYRLISPRINNLESICGILFESVVMGATIWGTWSQVLAGRRAGLRRQSVANSLLSNGLLYYGVFFALGMCSTVSYDLKPTPAVTALNIFTNQFSDPVRWALTCQFLLELRGRSETVNDSTYGVSLSTMTSFHATADFIRTTLNQDFGEPLVHPVHSMAIDDNDGGPVSEASDETKSRNGLEEGMELRQRFRVMEAAEWNNGADA